MLSIVGLSNNTVVVVGLVKKNGATLQIFGT